MADFQPGAVFAGHRIEGLAGRGGMGVVYRATQLALDRVVALKLIAPALATDADFRRRFVRESKAAASIEHPNVIPIYYAGEREGDLFIAMRYVDGQDLRTLIRAAGRLDEARTAHVVAQVGAALDAAHARGLVHRDVKPANVLTTTGPEYGMVPGGGAHGADHAYLTDFGLTKRVHSQSGLSRPGGWVGTLGYVAPEQIRGGHVDARADVYALGCVLVHALTGRPPYVRDTEEATLWAHLNEPPPASTDGVPAAFLEVVARALAKDPDERFQSAGDLGRAALAAAGSRVPAAPERLVARGAAAPGSTTRTATTRMAGEGDDAEAATALAVADPATETRWNEYGEAAADDGWGDSRAGDGPRATGRRRAPFVAAAAVVLAAIAVVVALATGGDDPAPDRTGTTTAPGGAGGGGELAVLEQTSTRPVRQPTNIAVAGGSVWITTYNTSVLGRVDATSGARREARRGIPRGTTDIVAASGGRLYLVSEKANAVTQVEASTGRVQRRIALPPGNPFAVDADRNAIWVGARASRNRNPVPQILRVDRRTGNVVKATPVTRGIKDLTVTRDAVWVTNERGSSVTKLDKRTGALTFVKVQEGPIGIAAGSGYLWVANEGSDSVTRIDPDTNRRASRSVGAQPQLVTTGGGAVWVSVGGASEVVRLNPKDLAITGRARTALNPFGIAYLDGGVWVASNGEDVVQRIAPRGGAAGAG